MNILLNLLALTLISSCMESKTTLEFLSEREGANSKPLKTWNFSNSGDYTFDSNYVEVTAGNANLKAIDLSHSGVDFNSGSHVGSSLISSKLTLDTELSLETHVNSILPTKSGNLVGYWRMDGDWADSSGNGNHGSVIGGASFNTISQIGSHSGEFNGSTDYVKVYSSGELISQNDFAMCAWINRNVSGVEGIIFAQVDDNSGRSTHSISIRNDNRLVYDNYLPSGGDIKATTTFVIGQWYHICTVRSSDDVSIYVDGALESTGTGEVRFSAGGVDSTYIGSVANAGTPIWPFNGMIDELSVWNTPINSEDVRLLYEATAIDKAELSSSWTPKYSDLVGYWKMDGNWQDSSGNGNHGTAVSDATITTNSKIGSGAGSFDGAGDYINIVGTPFNFTNSFTISSWFNSTELSGSKALVCKAQGSSYCLESINGTLRLAIHDGTTYRYAIANEPHKTNRWIHVASVVEFPNVYLYLNGVKQSTSGLLTGAVSANSQSLRIAHNPPGGAFHFKGLMDETAIWRSELTSEEISLVYNRQKQKYAGHYESPIINMGTPSAPRTMEWLTDLPFMKELPQTSESSADYLSLVGSTGNTSDNDLMSGIVGLWNFNETSAGTAPLGDDINDASGNSNHGSANLQTVYNENGVLGKAIRISASTVGVEVDDSDELDNCNTLSISGWIKPDVNDGATRFIYIKRASYLVDDSYTVFLHTGGNLKFRINGISDLATSSPIPTNKWTHFSAVFDGTEITSQRMKIYINGDLDATGSSTSTSIPNNSSVLKIGSTSYSGYLDEFAQWNRPLHADEISQLYRRGANRLKIQTRTCADSTCSANEQWQGPDNANGEFYFSELNNCDRLTASGVCDFAGGGEVNTVKPTLDLTNTGDFTNYVLAQPQRQYFQYRILMESDSEDATPTFPGLTSIDFGTKYWGGKPTIVTNNGQAFRAWTGFSATTSGGCTVSYQVSNDNSTWYFYDGVTDNRWEAVTGANETNTQTQLNANASTFASAIGIGTLYFKVFLNSDTDQSCSIDEIQVTGK